MTTTTASPQTAKTTMCRGEFVARAWHRLRVNPDGFPVAHFRLAARVYSHRPGDVLGRVLALGKAIVVIRDGERWLTRGPRWEPHSQGSEGR